MINIEWKLINFREGIEHLVGKKLIEKPTEGTYNNPNDFDFSGDIEFFDDGSVLATVSAWEKGYYGEVDSESPKFYLGRIV